MLVLWEMLVLGSRLMTLSDNIANSAIDHDAPTLKSKTPTMKVANTSITGDSADTLPENPEAPPQIGGVALAFTLFVSLGFAVAVFFLGPLFITGLLHHQIGEGWLNLAVEGLIRLGLLIGYVYLIGRIPDIQRLFGYHGAEHKAINAIEHGEPLDVPHVRQASRVHTRCGTGFLLLVVVLSIFVFALVGSPPLLIKVVSRVILLPVIYCMPYESMRLRAANSRYPIDPCL